MRDFNVKQALTEALESKGYLVDYSDTYLNVADPKGLNCEFYPCVLDIPHYEIFSATYTLDGKEQDIDHEVTDETSLTDFVDLVESILNESEENLP